jgi:hypothetical protein
MYPFLVSARMNNFMPHLLGFYGSKLRNYVSAHHERVDKIDLTKKNMKDRVD